MISERRPRRIECKLKGLWLRLRVAASASEREEDKPRYIRRKGEVGEDAGLVAAELKGLEEEA